MARGKPAATASVDPPSKQASRSAATRSRLLKATVECIEEEGLARATSQRIARRAGVTVGAVQHHFLSKADVFAAVLARSAESLLRGFEGVDLEGASLEERVGIFVDRAWLHYGGPEFRSTLEIILSTRGATAHSRDDWVAGPVGESAAHASRLWRSVFSEVDLSAARNRKILSFAFGTLTGFAMMGRLQRNSGGMRPQLESLKTALVALFREAVSEEAAGAKSLRRTP